ncbi:hypothetical protein CJD_3089 [Clostridium perfringens D str. JGS1721]|uniref:Uncharacterized protein n=1 Tax=Clostridium perfringens D str. JGS1721 TaxID=488537 RepID=B1V4P2_CLOPF|nr:hypothetical protein CJD_3089 [Clostridium perfringens D str. JGS1721]
MNFKKLSNKKFKIKEHFLFLRIQYSVVKILNYSYKFN